MISAWKAPIFMRRLCQETEKRALGRPKLVYENFTSEAEEWDYVLRVGGIQARVSSAREGAVEALALKLLEQLHKEKV